MSGRPPKPTNLKVIEGNKGKRAIANNEPDPALLNDLNAPEWLPEDARLVWDEIAPILRKNLVLTELDVPALEQGCVAIAKYRLLTSKINNDFVYTTDKGNQSLSQLLIAQSMYYKQAMAVFQQFGMTPAARTRIAIQVQDDLFGKQPTQKDQYFA